MKRAFIVLFILSILSVQCAFAGAPHTPKKGSAERQAICDGVRAYVISDYLSPTERQPFLFQIERIEVMGNYASFEGIALFKDEERVNPQYITDTVFNVCLRKNKNTWHVIHDFTRSDVPDDAELQQIWNAFPKDFPFALLPEFWRDLLQRFQ